MKSHDLGVNAKMEAPSTEMESWFVKHQQKSFDETMAGFNKASSVSRVECAS